MVSNAIAQWAHDIRNTLGTVALYLESLERSSAGDVNRVLARSDALLKKAASMCSDLMREAVQQGTQPPRRPFDITRTIAEVIGLIAPIVPATTTLDLTASGPVYVIADPKDVFRILFNLIHNAVGVARATGAPRSIKLALEQSGTNVTVTIADDGPGLPRDVRERLFQLFERDRSTGNGHGYGLSIARELAERNGAFLDLEDSVRGTAFALKLQGIETHAQRKAAPYGPSLAAFEIV